MVFPKTTGPFEVGCMDILTKAKSAPKDFHPKTLHDTKLGSLIRLYYPCNGKTNKFKRAKWLPEPFQKMYAYGYAKASQASSFFGWMMYLLARSYSMQAFQSAPLVDQEEWKTKQNIESLKTKEKLPVIVFSHGIKSNRTTYSTFCTQLASEGNVVAAVEHRDGSMSVSFICDEENRVIEIPHYFPTEDEVVMKVRNMQLQQRTREISDAINLLEQVDKDPSGVVDLVNVFQLEHGCSSSGQTSGKLLEGFKGRLDMDSMIMMGHSFGGATTVNALREEPRLLLMFDWVLNTPLNLNRKLLNSECCKNQGLRFLSCSFDVSKVLYLLVLAFFSGGISLDTWFEPCSDKFYQANNEEDKPLLTIFTEYFNWKYNVKLLQRFLKRYKKPELAEVVTLKEAAHYDQSDIPAIIPRILKSLFDTSHGRRIDFNVAIEVQRNLITDYISNFRQDHGRPLLANEYQLDYHFMLGTNIILEEKENDDRSKNSEVKEEEITDRDSKL